MLKQLVTGIMMSSILLLSACDAMDSIDSAEFTSQLQSVTFTLEELSLFDGVQQSTTYVAVDGIVYDVTDEFNKGQHQGMQLGGQDVTAVIAQSPHLRSVLTELPVVGVLLDSSVDGREPIDAPSATATDSGILPVFTLEELAKYTGANGSTAYVAVNGVIYDVTQEWSNGMHQGMQLAGTDASAIFQQSPHSQAFLSRLQIIGSLEGAPEIDAATVSSSTSNMYNYDYDDDDDDDNDDDHDDDGDDHDGDDHDDDAHHDEEDTD